MIQQPQQKIPYFKTLRFKLAAWMVVVYGVILCLSLAATFYAMDSLRLKFINNLVRNDLVRIAEDAAKKIDVRTLEKLEAALSKESLAEHEVGEPANGKTYTLEDLDEIQGAWAEQNPQFKDFVKTLKTILHDDRRIYDVYIFLKAPEEGASPLYLFDYGSIGSTEGPAEVGDEGGDDYTPDVYPALFEGFERPAADEDIGGMFDKWGVWISGYAPIKKKDGTPYALVGIDFNFSDFVNVKYHILGGFIVAIIVSIIASIIVGRLLARSFTRPIDSLVATSDKVAHGDFSVTVPVTNKDEFGILQGAYNHMIKGLNERELYKTTFARYVTKQVADVILKDPGKISLQGERMEVSLLFSDLRGFTSLSDKLPPEDVVYILNRYFTRMIDVIFEHEGTLDKFIGDGMMVIFGAPLKHDDHALRAVRTALDMQKAMHELNEELGRKYPFAGSLRIGIGINSGHAVVGNIGSEKRMEYTAIGDTVNLASRLEELTKKFGEEIIISADTYDKVKAVVEVKDLGLIKVRGKEDEVRVYAVKSS